MPLFSYDSLSQVGSGPYLETQDVLAFMVIGAVIFAYIYAIRQNQTSIAHSLNQLLITLAAMIVTFFFVSRGI